MSELNYFSPEENVDSFQFPPETIQEPNGTKPSNPNELAGQAAIVNAQYRDSEGVEQENNKALRTIAQSGSGTLRDYISTREKELEKQVYLNLVKTSDTTERLQDTAKVAFEQAGKPPTSFALENAFVETVDQTGDSAKKQSTKEDLIEGNTFKELFSKENSWGYSALETLAEIGRNLILPATSQRTLAKAAASAFLDRSLESLMEKSGIGYYDVLKEARVTYANANQEQKEVLERSFVRELRDHSGLIWNNEQEVRNAVSTFLNGTEEDAFIHNLFSGIDLLTIPFGGAIIKGVTKAAGKTAAAVTSKLGAKELAAKVIEGEIVSGTEKGASGLTYAEKVQEAFAAGKNPLTTDKETVVSTHIQRELDKRSGELLERVKNVQAPDLLTSAEKEAAIAEVVGTSSRAPSVITADFVALDGNRVILSTTRQTDNSLPFASKEQALEIAALRGHKDIEIIPVKSEVPIVTSKEVVSNAGEITAKKEGLLSKIKELTSKLEENAKPKQAVRGAGTFFEHVYKNAPEAITEDGRVLSSKVPEEIKKSWEDVSGVSTNKPLTKAEEKAITGEIKSLQKELKQVGKTKPTYEIVQETTKDGYYYKVQETKHVDTSVVGSLPEAELKQDSKLGSILRSLTSWVDPRQIASPSIVASRVIGVFAQGALKRALEQEYNDAIRGLSSRQFQNVIAALVKNNQEAQKLGRVYNEVELRTMGLGDKEIISFYNIRNIRDTMWFLRNQALKNLLEARGFREVVFKGFGQHEAFTSAGKELKIEVVKAEHTKGNLIGLYDYTKGTPIEVTSDYITRLQEEGKKVIRLQEERKIGEHHYSHIVVDDSMHTIRDFDIVLGYRPAEFSRIYTDDYFVYITRQGMVDGVEKQMTKVIRTASKEKEAKSYIEAFNSVNKFLKSQEYKLGDRSTAIHSEVSRLIGKYTDPLKYLDEVDSGKISIDEHFGYKFDRETSGISDSLANEMIDNGRLFFDKKGSHLLSVDNDNLAGTTDVIESMQRELGNLARYTNLATWKEFQVKRWLNTFGDAIVNRTGNDWQDFINGQVNISQADKAKQIAENTRDYILYQSGIKEDSVLASEARWRALVEFLEDKPVLGMLATSLNGLKRSSPLNIMRAANFHITLGMFNLAQLMVQGNGAAVATILHPVYGTRAIFSYPIIKALTLARYNPAALEYLSEVISKVPGSSLTKDDLSKYIKALDKTGIISDLTNHDLYNPIIGKATFLPKGIARNIQATGRVTTLPFRTGEEFSRMVSFDIARREWMKINKGLDWTSDEALTVITKRADVYTMGMTSANTARWQRGVFSIPFQFLQYQFKLSSAMLGKNSFTGAEKAKILTGMSVLYGAAGMGLSDLANDWLSGSPAENLPKEAKLAITQGILSSLVWSITEDDNGEGVTTALGARLGPGDWYARTFKDIFINKKTPALDYFLGPSGNFISRTVEIVDYLQMMNSAPENVYDPEVVLDYLNHALTTLPSSFRTATKYQYAVAMDGALRGKYTDPVAYLNKREAMWAIFGFTPLKEHEKYRSQDILQDHKRAVKDIVDSLIYIRNEQFKALSYSDKERFDRLEKARKGLYMGMNNLAFAREVQEELRKHSLSPIGQDELTKNINNLKMKLTKEGEHLPWFSALDNQKSK